MPVAYSGDLRRRVIDADEANEGSQRQLAQRFACQLIICAKPVASLPLQMDKSKPNVVEDTKNPQFGMSISQLSKS